MMDKNTLMSWISISIVEVEKKWSGRAAHIIFDLRKAALVYMSQ